MSSVPAVPLQPSDGGSSRLEFFSDAIMAIAITLLVIEIRVPVVAGQHLGQALGHLWPSYLAYALSFGTIGLIWVAHHSMFRRVGSVDRILMLINLSLMACVAFLPFSTAVLAQYSRGNASAASTSAEMYSINMFAIGVAFLGLWLYLAAHQSLFAGDIGRAALKQSIFRSTVVPTAYLITVALAFVSPVACYVIWVATTIYIALGPATRRIQEWTKVAIVEVGEAERNTKGDPTASQPK